MPVKKSLLSILKQQGIWGLDQKTKIRTSDDGSENVAP